jgi:hypothetical protein
MNKTKHIHGPYNQRSREEMIMDLLCFPAEYHMSCKQGITVLKFRTPKNEVDKKKAMWGLQNRIANWLNQPDRKFNRGLVQHSAYKKTKGKEEEEYDARCSRREQDIT